MANEAPPWRAIPLAIGAHPTTLKAALLHCPGAHAFWSWWLVSLVHLRPVEGYPPPHVSPGMTHELAVLAINPELCPEPDPAAHQAGYPCLTPPDVVEQFAAPSDGAAEVLFDDLCKLVAARRLSPDSDYRRLWVTLVAGWGALWGNQ